ncbi:MAG: hypothetical protein DME82_04335 [Verrucomicrobia bacterium]|nr:MAG: hypothetical protein DME82_04335 [Verrucomicrobiota bacterium]
MENRTIRIRVAVICGLLICAVAITTRTVTIAAANQNSYGAHGVYTTAATPTPTATPCASVGSWTEQAPYPIAIWGHAVASVGGNVYSFGGIVNNTAITNAYKYSPASNTWTPVAPLPEPRAWFSGTTDGTYIYLRPKLQHYSHTLAVRPDQQYLQHGPATLYHPYLLPCLCLPQRQDLSHCGPRYRHRFSRRGLRHCHKYLVHGCELPGR